MAVLYEVNILIKLVFVIIYLACKTSESEEDCTSNCVHLSYKKLITSNSFCRKNPYE